MRKISIQTFSDSIKVSQNIDLYIIFFQREEYKQIISKFSELYNQLEHWYSIRVGDKFYEVMVFSKEETIYYNPMLSLRTVLTPFVQDGKPRGWFYDENMKPARFTGIGNSLYFGSKENDISWECYRLFCDMYVEKGDEVITNIKNINPSNEKALISYEYRFCPLSKQNEREQYFMDLKADKRFRFGASIN